MDTSLPLTLADREGMMVSPIAAEALGAELGGRRVGTGPFRLAEFRSADRLVVERDDECWRPGCPASMAPRRSTSSSRRHRRARELLALLVDGAPVQAFQDDVHEYVPSLCGKPQLDDVWMAR